VRPSAKVETALAVRPCQQPLVLTGQVAAANLSTMARGHPHSNATVATSPVPSRRPQGEDDACAQPCAQVETALAVRPCQQPLVLTGPVGMRRERRPSLPPIRQALPLELNSIRATCRSGLAGMVPSGAVHVVTTLVGFVPFTLGYTFGMLETAISGTRMNESACFKAGSLSLLYAMGIFPTVLYDQGDGELGSSPAGETEQSALLRSTPLLVSNHISYLDALILPLMLEWPKFMSMAVVKSWPLFGSIAQELDYIWVDRGSKNSRAAALDAIDAHVGAWRHGDRPLLLFPEGTTTNGRSMVDFKKGAFFTGAPVRPVLVKYTGAWDPACVDFLEPGDPEVDGEVGANDVGAMQQSLRYTDSDWFAQFVGHLLHSCTLLVCKPYIPCDAEKANPDLYAANVRAFMLNKLHMLNLVCDHSSSSDSQVLMKNLQRVMRVKSQLHEWSSRAHLRKRLQEREKRVSRRRSASSAQFQGSSGSSIVN